MTVHYLRWGVATTADGERLLASEPYCLSDATRDEVRTFVDRMSLRMDVSANSRWFPGRTARTTLDIPEQEHVG